MYSAGSGYTGKYMFDSHDDSENWVQILNLCICTVHLYTHTYILNHKYAHHIASIQILWTIIACAFLSFSFSGHWCFKKGLPLVRVEVPLSSYPMSFGYWPRKWQEYIVYDWWPLRSRRSSSWKFAFKCLYHDRTWRKHES